MAIGTDCNVSATTVVGKDRPMEDCNTDLVCRAHHGVRAATIKLRYIFERRTGDRLPWQYTPD